MNAREALEVAIRELRKDGSEEHIEAEKAINKLKRKDFVTRWTKESIVKACDAWIKKNGHIPCTKNLREPGMPSPDVIRKHFNVSAGTFLRQRYPSYAPPKPTSIYEFETTEEWLNCFREQFLKHCDEEGFGSRTYNILKDEGTPQWATIAKHCGTMNWTKLMEIAGVKYNKRIVECAEGKVHIGTVKSPWLERYEAAVAKKEELDQKLLDAIEEKKKSK